MEHKFLEIRDRHTMIPVLCLKMVSEPPDYNLCDEIYLQHMGFTDNPRCILVMMVNARHLAYEPWTWQDRTMTTAHQYIEQHWSELRSGQVIDVRVIKGEAAEPARPEIFLQCLQPDEGLDHE